MSAGESYYRLETVDGCLIITLLPELNDKQWADIERVGTEMVDRLSTAQSPRFIVDLSQLSYMGSAMVALIVRLYKSVNGRNGQMVVVNQHELVFEVLKLAGLTKLWTIVDSREKAFAALGVKRRGGASAIDGPVTDGGNGILVAGIIGTVGAVIGLALQFSSNPPVSHKVALLIDVAFAALGMVVGTMILVNQTGARRNVGIALLAICLMAVLGGIVFSPAPTPAQAPAANSSVAPGSMVPAATVVTTSTSPTAATPLAATPAAGTAAKIAPAGSTQTATPQPGTTVEINRRKKDK